MRRRRRGRSNLCARCSRTATFREEMCNRRATSSGGRSSRSRSRTHLTERRRQLVGHLPTAGGSTRGHTPEPREPPKRPGPVPSAPRSIPPRRRPRPAATLAAARSRHATLHAARSPRPTHTRELRLVLVELLQHDGPALLQRVARHAAKATRQVLTSSLAWPFARLPITVVSVVERVVSGRPGQVPDLGTATSRSPPTWSSGVESDAEAVTDLGADGASATHAALNSLRFEGDVR